MQDEQTVLEEQRPTDEQATAFLQGDRKAVEPQESKPVAQPEATAPAAPAAPPVLEKSETEMLKMELNRLKSEVGQFRKRFSESSRTAEPKQVTPQSWAQMTPEQQAQWMELFEHTFQQKYGTDWNEFQELKEQRKVEAQIETVKQYSMQYAGELHEKLDPIMGRIYAELREKAQQGDEESEQLLHEIKTTRSGVKYLVDLAKQEYSQSIEAKGEQAKATQTATAKKAGVTLGSTPQAAPQPDILKNLPSDPAKAAEVLRAELIKRGAL